MAAARRTDADRLAAARLSILAPSAPAANMRSISSAASLPPKSDAPVAAGAARVQFELDHGCRAALKEWETAATAVVAELTTNGAI